MGVECEVPDPRPKTIAVDGGVAVLGQRCAACDYVCVGRLPRCPACRGDLHDETFGPDGVVFASTVLRIGLPGRTPPYGLAYVILDSGPRVLAHAPARTALPVGSRARLTSLTEEGDLWAEPKPGESA